MPHTPALGSVLVDSAMPNDMTIGQATRRIGVGVDTLHRWGAPRQQNTAGAT
jgi:hypothetical protein